MIPSRAIEVAVPAEVTELGLLDRVDYADAFRVDTDLVRTPQQWMRTFIEDSPPWFRRPWILLARLLLRLEPGPMTGPDHVLGWAVHADRPDTFAVGLDRADGPFARLTAHTAPGQVVIATQLHLEPARIRTLWPAIRPAHRFFAPYLLNRAAEHLSTPARP